MIKPFEHQLSLFLKLQSFFQEQSSVYSSNPHLVQSVLQLNTNIETLLQLGGETNRRIAFSTETKAEAKKTLANALLNYHAKLLPWFFHNADPLSPMQTRFTPSQIQYAPDAQLLLIGAKSYDYVQANLAALTAYGFTAPLQAELQNAITTFENLSDKPRRELNNRKINQGALKATIEKTRKLVREDITIYMGTYQYTEPSFYSLFKIIARLGKIPHRTMALRVTIGNAAGQPLPMHSVSVQAATGQALLKTSGKSGQLNFQNLPKGPCTITCQSPNGNTQTEETEIKSSERVDIAFVF